MSRAASNKQALSNIPHGKVHPEPRLGHMAPAAASDAAPASKQESPEEHEHRETQSSILSINSARSESQVSSSRAPHDEKNDGVWSTGLDGLDVGAGVDPQNTAELGMSRSQSRASSTRTRPAVVVPRGQRRGLLSRFTIVPEVVNPYDYKRVTKWGITATIAVATAAAPLGSSIFYPMSIFPIWWSAFSEQFGRRSIYLASFSLFVLFSIASALSVDISMLIVMRIGVGGASASVQAVGAGTIADIWEPRERGLAMSMRLAGSRPCGSWPFTAASLSSC
ncbi:Quinidine resistance protein 3 [Beauveria bassiana D1-5]|uniref:Quinidine resistance protein 3 n=1 Tax=Beauveria bassiana D1-5 TaxID=1245745 RepID=A0A0A2VWA1_BEABA|nr:Quinidine resistance protein 3 [Beauveria bassiana D1-5]